MLQRIKHLSRYSMPLDGAGIAAIGEQASCNNRMWATERTLRHELRGAE